MKCPTCTEPSKVYLVSREREGNTQPPAGAIFWDEVEVKHVHDPRAYVANYLCDNGHRWFVTQLESCPATGCNFGKEPPTTTMRG